MIQLEVNPLMFGLTLAVFLFMIALLNNWLYKPMLAYMEDRDASIKNDLAEANSNDSDIKALEAKAQSIIDEAKAEAAALRQKMLDDAKLLASSKIEAKRNELEGEYTTFSSELKVERESLKSSLLSQKSQFQDTLKTKFSQI